ncbi:MAG: NYN domain-containing protein [bacterium]
MKLFRWWRQTKGSSALFIDFENLVLSLRDAGSSEDPDPIPLLELTRKNSPDGTLAYARAWADWRHFRQQQRIFKRAGIETIQADTHSLQGKNATDIYMAVDITDLMHRRPNLEVIVLVTGDSDFNPLVELLRHEGKQVIGVGVEGAVSRRFAEVCNRFHYVSELSSVTERQGQLKPYEKKSSSTHLTDAGSSENDLNPELLSVLGLSEGGVIPSKRLRQLLPMASEAWSSVFPEHATDFRKAMMMRHEGKVRQQEAAILAHLLRSIGGYGSHNGHPWLDGPPLKGDEGYDLVLAASVETLERHGLAEARDLQSIHQAITGELCDSAELRMRTARGRQLLEQRRGVEN